MKQRNKTASVNQNMVRGSVWAVAMRWTIRLLGLISTIILARLLTPQDFGIIVMASIVIGLIDLCTEFGVGMLLIREVSITRADCDTAWTFRVLQGIVLALIMILLSEIAVSYFNEARLAPVLKVLAMVAVISGLQNIGMVLVRKELDFAKDFRFEVYKKIASFCCIVTCALLLRSYWGLVLGRLIASLIHLAISYIMHPYRPKLSLQRWRFFIHFSVAMIGGNVGKFLNERFDTIAIGGLYNTASLGLYNVASELAKLATKEVTMPIGRALMPSYASISEDKQALSRAYLTSFSFIALIILPLGTGLSSIAEPAVVLIYGSKWRQAAPLLSWLALYSIVSALIGMLGDHILITLRREKLAMSLRFVQLAILAPIAWYCGATGSAELVAKGITLSAIALLPLHAWALMRHLPVTLFELLGCLWRPVISSAVMMWVIGEIDWQDMALALHLMVAVFSGAVVYLALIVFLWALCGKPKGPEQTLLTLLATIFATKFLRKLDP
jgi:lipopolysaccharide exporter